MNLKMFAITMFFSNRKTKRKKIMELRNSIKSITCQLLLCIF